MTPSNTSVLLIYTGGTIGMIENTETGALENFNFEQLQKHVPELRKSNCTIDSYQFDPPMDSSDMEPEAWRKLVKIIVIITTGSTALLSSTVRTQWHIPPRH